MERYTFFSDLFAKVKVLRAKPISFPLGTETVFDAKERQQGEVSQTWPNRTLPWLACDAAKALQRRSREQDSQGRAREPHSGERATRAPAATFPLTNTAAGASHPGATAQTRATRGI